MKASAEYQADRIYKNLNNKKSYTNNGIILSISNSANKNMKIAINHLTMIH